MPNINNSVEIFPNWGYLNLRLYRFIFSVRPAFLALFLKWLLGIKRRWIHLQGVKFFIDPVSHFGQEVINTGSYEPLFCDSIMKLLKPGDSFLDIGANEGFFSIKAASVVGSKGKVIAIEPQPDLADLIAINSKNNGFENLQVQPLAFSEKKGKVELALSLSVNTGTSSLFTNKVSGFDRIWVCGEPFDEWWLSQSKPFFDAVKIDCEGAEVFIFRTANKALGQHFAKMIFLEYHENIIGSEGVWEIDDAIRSNGYILSELKTGVWVYHLSENSIIPAQMVRRTVPRLKPGE
ncbi:MAG: FkbM family methyltransferase [Deltaproteobacteria bacterium]